LGCHLDFYDVRDDFSIDLDEIESKISPATKALYAIHFFGFPGPIVELREMADRHGLALVEDTALSMLARHGGRPLGTFGDVSIFCLYKTVPTAAGGVLAINRPDIPLPPAPRHVSLYNELNLTTKRILAHIEQHGGRLTRGLKTVVECFARLAVRGAKIQVTSPDALDFDPTLLEWDLGPITIEKLHAVGIEAVPVWGVPHPHVPRGEFPGTEFLQRHLIELPVYQDLSEKHLQRIRDALLEHAQWPTASLWRDSLPSACVAVG
jgi:hypothetical protein